MENGSARALPLTLMWGHRVETRLGPQNRAKEAGKPRFEEGHQFLMGAGIRLEGPGVRRDHVTAAVDRGLGRHLAVDGEAVEVAAMPDEDREAVRRELPQVRRREVRHLLLRDRDRPLDAE